MASPTYGTNLSNYMNILAGQARGMNESERLSRMQEKQDYSQAFNMLQYEDRIGNRDAQQQQNYDWNAYNAGLKQQNAQQDYDWNVYNDSLRQEQSGYQRGRDTVNDAARAEALRYSRQRDTQNDAYRNEQLRSRYAPKGIDMSKIIKNTKDLEGLSQEAQRSLGITDRNDYKPDSFVWDALKTAGYYGNPSNIQEMMISLLGGKGITGGSIYQNLFNDELEQVEAERNNARRLKQMRDLARR